MDAIAQTATRRLDSSLHAVGTSAPAIAVESARTLSVTADYRLSEAGRKASLLSGGNGHAEQRVKIAVPLTRLHLVHVDNNGVARLKLFQRELVSALDKTGIGRHKHRPYNPHITLLYDEHRIPDQPVEAISWIVREVVLVCSLQGQGRHIMLARWPLRG